ncbi:hypothetical protein JHK85_028204 [Glycine max]|nr:hypothetical protein JHK85_028204 [Glycine max]
MDSCNVVRGKRAMKERIRQAQRVFEGYIEKQHDLARRGVARDKLVFGDVETWPYHLSLLSRLSKSSLLFQDDQSLLSRLSKSSLLFQDYQSLLSRVQCLLYFSKAINVFHRDFNGSARLGELARIAALNKGVKSDSTPIFSKFQKLSHKTHKASIVAAALSPFEGVKFSTKGDIIVCRQNTYVDKLSRDEVLQRDRGDHDHECGSVEQQGRRFVGAHAVVRWQNRETKGRERTQSQWKQS